VTETAAGTEANETRPGEASVSPGLFVTTSGGVLFCRSGTGAIDSIVESGSRRWTGFFGIARHPRTGTIFAACRARLGTRRVRKHSTDVILYAIDPLTHEAEPVAEIPDVHDVHQIEVGDEHVFLTDTGLNRIHLWDLEAGKTVRIVEVGGERDDINHLNALLLTPDDLLVGMNNRGREPAAVMRLPLSALSGDTEFGDVIIRAGEIGRVTPLPGFEHTHDLEPWRGEILACASHHGTVLRTAPPGVLFSPGGWVRGLTADGEDLWVGISAPAERADRHSRSLDGQVRRYRGGVWTEQQRIALPGVGQVHDLLRQ